MKLLRTTLTVVLIVGIGLVLTKNLIAQAALGGGVKAITGLNTQLKSVDVGLLKTAVRIKGLRVLNPSGFPEPVLVDVPEVFVDYDLGALLKGTAHFESLRIHLAQLNVVKAPDGTLNLHTIKALEPGKAKEGAKPQQAGRPPAFAIDALELKIGKVVYTDYTVSPPQTREFNVNIDERYQHVTNPYTFTGLIVSRALLKTTVGQLANFDVSGLQATVTEGLKQSATQLRSTLKEGTKVAEQLGTGAVGTAKDVVEGTTGTLKKLLGN